MKHGPETILAVWKKKDQEFPLLAKFAKHVHAISATTASVERLWSRSKLFITPMSNFTALELLQNELFSYVNEKSMQSQDIDYQFVVE